MRNKILTSALFVVALLLNSCGKQPVGMKQEQVIKLESSSMKESISNLVYTAVKTSFSELLKASEGESIYVYALFTDDSLQFLQAVANSDEGLSSTVEEYRRDVDPEYGTTTTANGMK